MDRAHTLPTRVQRLSALLILGLESEPLTLKAALLGTVSDH